MGSLSFCLLPPVSTSREMLIRALGISFWKLSAMSSYLTRWGMQRMPFSPTRCSDGLGRLCRIQPTHVTPGGLRPASPFFRRRALGRRGLRLRHLSPQPGQLEP